MREVPSCYGSFANNTTKGLRSGSIISMKSPTCQPTVDLIQFIAKQGPCQLGLFLNLEANVKTLLLDIKMMVFPMQSTVPSATPVLLSQCVNPDQLKTERLENNLRPCGKCWLTNLNFSSALIQSDLAACLDKVTSSQPLGPSGPMAQVVWWQ